MDGEYSEQLPCGGTLKVSGDKWHIQYYFAGFDRRYNGEFCRIEGLKIDEYISAWKENFDEYKKLKVSIPSGGDFSKPGKLGMNIRVGSFEGVCLKSYHMPIKTEEGLTKVINSYRYAKDQALKAIKLLKTL